ncbi:chromatin binding protein, partial [Entophlyctis luteolus]
TRTDYPEAVAYAVDRDIGTAGVCRFDLSGNFAAIGSSDGSTAIFDLHTKDVCAELLGHVAAVTSLSWSHLHLLSASRDWTCILWDVARAIFPHAARATMHPASPKAAVIRFASPVLTAVLRPRKSIPASGESFSGTVVAVCTLQHPWVVDITPDSRGILVQRREPLFPADASPEVLSSTHVVVAVNAAEKILRCYNLERLVSLGSDLQSSGASSDDAPAAIEPDSKFFDSVDQNRWSRCVFSPNSKYFVGASAVKTLHKIYIWELYTGALAKLLELPRDCLMDIAWHPKLPVLMSLSANAVNIWTVKIRENWSAFAPDFKELDENAEYEELEDEFDISGDTHHKKISSKQIQNEDEFVDVVGLD